MCCLIRLDENVQHKSEARRKCSHEGERFQKIKENHRKLRSTPAEGNRWPFCPVCTYSSPQLEISATNREKHLHLNPKRVEPPQPSFPQTWNQPNRNWHNVWGGFTCKPLSSSVVEDANHVKSQYTSQNCNCANLRRCTWGYCFQSSPRHMSKTMTRNSENDDCWITLLISMNDGWWQLTTRMMKKDKMSNSSPNFASQTMFHGSKVLFQFRFSMKFRQQNTRKPRDYTPTGTVNNDRIELRVNHGLISKGNAASRTRRVLPSCICRNSIFPATHL